MLSLEKRVEMLENRYRLLYHLHQNKNQPAVQTQDIMPPPSNTGVIQEPKANERPVNIQRLQDDLPILPEPVLPSPPPVKNEALRIRFGKHPNKHRVVIDFTSDSSPEFDFVTTPNMISVTLNNTIWRGQTVGFPDLTGLWVEHYNIEQKDTKAILNLGVSSGVYVYKIFDVPPKEPDQNARLVIDITK